MSEPVQRRPLPALIFLVAITLLTAVVWWRVATRHSSSGDSTPVCNPSATPSLVPPAKGIDLTVLNATVGYKNPRSGIAGAAAKRLKAQGFTITKATNDNGTGVAGVAVIRYGPDQKAQALLVSYYLPGSQLAEQSVDQDGIIISLGLKYTTVASTAQVNAALAKAKIKVGTVTATASAC